LSFIERAKSFLNIGDHRKKQDYNTYKDYLNHQKEKTLDPVRREKWLNKEWAPKVQYFQEEFEYVKSTFKLELNGKGLGLGARTGQEVQAMINIGLNNSVGVDLVANEPLVVEGDIHDLSFGDNSFGFVFTNIYDHSLYPKKFLKEICRVLNQGGVGLIHLQVGMVTDEYGVVDITSTKSIEKELEKLGAKIITVEDITKRDVIDMSTRLLFQKR
jgi:SAM-dependent methyltransferase